MIRVLILASLLFSSSVILAQSTEVVLIRTFENLLSEKNSFLEVVENDGTQYVIELEKFHTDKEKRFNQNLPVLREQLKKYMDLGYTVESSSSGGATSAFITTYVLVKKKD